MQMTKNREKVQETLKMDYKDIDKKYKEQLIKTKVRLQPAVCFHADDRLANLRITTLRSMGKLSTSG